MKTIILHETYIGTQFPCALEYGDYTGLIDNEERQLEDWFSGLVNEAEDRYTANPYIHFEYGEAIRVRDLRHYRTQGQLCRCHCFHSCLGTIMTKKHFEAIAKILKAQNANLALVMELAAYFEFTNPNFDAERFVKACLNSK
jgi:hypothetical protein